MGRDEERCAEASVSVVLASDSRFEEARRKNPEMQPLCKLTGFKMLYQPTSEVLKDAVAMMLQEAGKHLSDVSFILTGISGNPDSDAAYFEETKRLFGDKPLLKYKPLFGESFAASGIGFYVAAQCLKAQYVPKTLFVNSLEEDATQLDSILIFSHSDGKDFTLTLMERQ